MAPVPPEEIAQLMQFIAKKTKNARSPLSIRQLARQFKEKSGSLMALGSVEARIERYRQKIHKMNEFDMDTKVKMMFAISAPINKEFLNELKKQADVGVDERGRITNYQSNDGNLKLGGNHGISLIKKTMHSDRWQKVCQKANDDGSEEDDNEDANGQKVREKKRIDLVKFLIQQTKNATFPFSVQQLAKDYKTKIKCSESQNCIRHLIKDFRRRIHKMNQFDMPTKVKMLFALSSSIDAEFLKKLQEDAIVELDEQLRIKKYKANDGSLILKGDHSISAKTKGGMKKRRVVDDSSESEDDEDEKNVGRSLKSNQASTSLPKKRSQKIRKSAASTPNMNKKRATNTQKQLGLFRGKKRTRISYSSSEASENDKESMALENDPVMDSEANNLDHGGDDFDYDPPSNNHYEENLEHEVTDPNSERDIDIPEVTDDVEEEGKKEEESSNNHYDEDLEHKVTGPNSEQNIATPEVRDEMEEEENKEEESSASSSAEIESMSLLELLNHLRAPTLQYIPTLVPKIDENIKQLDSEDQQIPINKVLESFESCIQILSSSDEMDPDENTTSLSDFYYHLGMALCNITHSSMDDFHVKMRKLATTGDEKVSMEHIQYAMRKTLDKILH